MGVVTRARWNSDGGLLRLPGCLPFPNVYGGTASAAVWGCPRGLTSVVEAVDQMTQCAAKCGLEVAGNSGCAGSN